MKPDGIFLSNGPGDPAATGEYAVPEIRKLVDSGKPVFGICLGLQCATIEFARNVLKLPGANSTEFDPNARHPVINMMEEQKQLIDKGATMRLGSYECTLTPGSKAGRAYKAATVRERHRHRYEVNNAYVGQLQRAGLMVSGINARRHLVEIVELALKKYGPPVYVRHEIVHNKRVVEDLKAKLRTGWRGTVVTTIQAFQRMGDLDPITRDNIISLVDEAKEHGLLDSQWTGLVKSFDGSRIEGRSTPDGVSFTLALPLAGCP